MKQIRLKIKAVILDMDGVITNTMSYHFRAWRTIFAREGISVNHVDVYSREGQRGIHSVKEIFRLHRKEADSKMIKKILRTKELLFKKIVKRRFIAGARKFLRSLHKRGFRLALVTGTSRHELHRILPQNIYRLFDTVVTGSDVKDGKPHPRPFLLALKNLRIKAHEAIVIENAPFGIKSAKKAGIKCFAIETSLPRRFLAKADKVFSSIQSLQKRVKFVPANSSRK